MVQMNFQQQKKEFDILKYKPQKVVDVKLFEY